MRRVFCLFAIIAGLLAAAPAARAIVNGQEPAANDRRFDAIGGVTLTQWTSEHNLFCNATLIAPDLVLTAAHCVTNEGGQSSPYVEPPDYYYTVRFRRHPSGELGSIENPQWFHDVRVVRWISIAVSTGHSVSADALLGVLETPVTHIEPLRVAHNRYPVALHPDRSLTTPVVVAGWGWTGPEFAQGERGRLRVATVTLLATNGDPAFARSENIQYPGAKNPNGCLCGPNKYDSGGPNIIEDCWGNLVIIGVITGADFGVEGTSSGPSIFAAANTAGFGELVFTPPLSSLDLNHDSVLTHADYVLFMNGYINAAGYRGLCSDFNDSGTLSGKDRVAYILALTAAGGTYCAADVDLDGQLTEADFDTFDALFALHDPRADIDLNGDFNADDHSAFMTAFGLGC